MKRYCRDLEEAIIRTVADVRDRGDADRRAHRRLGRGRRAAAEDRLDRRPPLALDLDARLRAERRPRPGSVHGVDHRLRARGRVVHVAGARARPAGHARRGAPGGARRARRGVRARVRGAPRRRAGPLGAAAARPARGALSLATRLRRMQSSLPVAERPRRPEWMKVRAPSADGRYFDVKKLIHGASLHTICEEARCPNIAECWGRGTATFQILGETCTRACRYCYVHSGTPDPVDPLEPLRLAQTAAQMGLEHVVVTSVDRDDLPDRGAAHYAATIRALRAQAARGDRRGADAGLPRRRGGRARDGARGAARRLQPQHRDRPPPAPPHARREGELRRRALRCCAARRSSPTTP